MNEWVQLGLGVLALSFFWIHCLLIAAAAVQDLRDVGRWAKRWSGARQAKVRRGEGPGGSFARWRVEQTGRAKRSEQTVFFHDATYACELFGGRVVFADGSEETLPGAPEDAVVWLPPLARRHAVDAREGVDTEAALVAARKAKGYRRHVDVDLEEGHEVWLSRDGTCVASFDPRQWIADSRLRAVAFIVGHLSIAGACTVLALSPPLFGTLSMIGALGALVYFLTLAQPVGVWLHEALRSPDRAYVRGAWKL